MKTYQQLTQRQRYQIWAGLKRGLMQREIAEEAGVDRSTISRELRRNASKAGITHWRLRSWHIRGGGGRADGEYRKRYGWRLRSNCERVGPRNRSRAGGEWAADIRSATNGSTSTFIQIRGPAGTFTRT